MIAIDPLVVKLPVPIDWYVPPDPYVADVVETPVPYALMLVDEFGENTVVHWTSQSPAVSEALATFATVPDVNETPVRLLGVGYSPTRSAAALDPS